MEGFESKNRNGIAKDLRETLEDLKKDGFQFDFSITANEYVVRTGGKEFHYASNTKGEEIEIQTLDGGKMKARLADVIRARITESDIYETIKEQEGLRRQQKNKQE